MYTNLRHTASIVLPAAAALYIALASIWHFPKVEEVAGSIAAVNTFLGALLALSTKKYAGEIKVVDDGEKKTASLVVNGDPEQILSMPEATFKISDTGSTPIVKEGGTNASGQ